jgi:hypothetical protein
MDMRLHTDKFATFHLTHVKPTFLAPVVAVDSLLTSFIARNEIMQLHRFRHTSSRVNLEQEILLWCGILAYSVLSKHGLQNTETRTASYPLAGI